LPAVLTGLSILLHHLFCAKCLHALSECHQICYGIQEDSVFGPFTLLIRPLISVQVFLHRFDAVVNQLLKSSLTRLELHCCRYHCRLDDFQLSLWCNCPTQRLQLGMKPYFILLVLVIFWPPVFNVRTAGGMPIVFILLVAALNVFTTYERGM